MRLQSTSGTTGQAAGLFLAVCAPTDPVGAAVYISGAPVGEKYKVSKVDIALSYTMPAVGVIAKKLTSTECIVQTSGILKGVFTGLTLNKAMWADVNALLTQTLPPAPVTGKLYIQQMGAALSSTDVIITVLQPYIRT